MDNENRRYTCEAVFQTIITLYTLLMNSSMNINPEWQRNVVWKTEDSRKFITSIYMNIVPTNIILNQDTNSGKYTVIDGKQRLSSIINFLKSVKEYYLMIGETKYYYDKKPEEGCEIMTKKMQTYINNIKIPVIMYYDLAESDMKLIFRRIQYGVKVGVYEALKSMMGNGCNLVNELVKKMIERYKKTIIKKDDEALKIIFDCVYLYENSKIKSISKSVLETWIENKMNEKMIEENIEEYERYIFKVCDITEKTSKSKKAEKINGLMRFLITTKEEVEDIDEQKVADILDEIKKYDCNTIEKVREIIEEKYNE